jgi:hypothetical protein
MLISIQLESHLRIIIVATGERLIYIQDTIIINSYKYSYGFWNLGVLLRPPLTPKINFSIAGTRKSEFKKSPFRETKPYIFSVRWVLFLGRHVEKSVDAKYVFWTLSYIFSVRFHFPLASRGKSEDAKYIRSCVFMLFSYIVIYI